MASARDSELSQAKQELAVKVSSVLYSCHWMPFYEMCTHMHTHTHCSIFCLYTQDKENTFLKSELAMKDRELNVVKQQLVDVSEVRVTPKSSH